MRKLRRQEIHSFSIPVRDKECDFGKWLYSEGRLLKKIFPGEIEYIVKLHLHLHEVFEQIYMICFGKNVDKILTFFKLFKTLNDEEK